MTTPTFNEWLEDDFTQLVIKDIYDTLVRGAEKRSFYDYVSEVTEKRFAKQKAAAFRHMLPTHENMHAIDKDGGKPHLANAAARAFIARGQQIMLLRGDSMKDMVEAVDE